MATKIGVISDIHADLGGLEHALETLKAQQVDRILCLGDLVDRGFDGDEVIELLKQADIPCVLGNHDEDMIRAEEGYLIHERWEQVSDVSLAHLKDLPYKRDLHIEGIDVCIAHGSAYSNTDYLFPDLTRERYLRALEDAASSVLMVGHTHQPMKICIEGRGHIFNPGSVCLHERRDSGSCGILSLPEIEFTVLSVYSGKLVEIVERRFDP